MSPCFTDVTGSAGADVLGRCPGPCAVHHIPMLPTCQEQGALVHILPTPDAAAWQ